MTILGGAAGFGVAWVVFELIPRYRNFGIKVRWGNPPRDWMIPPQHHGSKPRYAMALVEHRSWFGLRRRLIYLPPLHTLVIGPSGSGKSTSLMSALLTWGGGVFVLDPKGEFYDVTAGWRKKELGHHVLRWDVRAGYASGGGLPIDALYGSRDNAIEKLAQLIIGQDAKQAPFVYPWIAIIKALIADAELKGAPPWTSAFETPSSQWQSRLEAIAKQPDHPGRSFALEALGKAPAQEYFASIAGTADQVAPVFRSIAGLLDAGSGASVPPLERSSIYLILPTNPLPGEMLALRWIFSGADSYVGRNPPIPSPGSAWIMDEAGALRPEGLDNWVRFMRGKNVAVVIATQNVSDLDDAYGRDKSASIIGAMNGPHIFISWRQMSEATISALAQSLTGHVTVQRRTGDRTERVPGDSTDARRALARMNHGIMFPKTGADRPCRVFPAPYYRWFKERVIPIETVLSEEERSQAHPAPAEAVQPSMAAFAARDDHPHSTPSPAHVGNADALQRAAAAAVATQDQTHADPSRKKSADHRTEKMNPSQQTMDDHRSHQHVQSLFPGADTPRSSGQAGRTSLFTPAEDPGDWWSAILRSAQQYPDESASEHEKERDSPEAISPQKKRRRKKEGEFGGSSSSSWFNPRICDSMQTTDERTHASHASPLSEDEVRSLLPFPVWMVEEPSPGV